MVFGCHAADLVELGASKMRQGDRECREVVEHENIFEPVAWQSSCLTKNQGELVK
jgi:hypothetical protein